MSHYIGRFAPSPTGALHAGSLLAAVGSYLDARAHQGKWLLRIEDIDTPRVMPGSTTQILKTLEAFGLLWDETETFQSQNTERYQNALTQLQQNDLVFPCICSRKQIQQSSHLGIDGYIYPGTCRNKTHTNLTQAHAWRLKTPDRIFTFHDRIAGIQQQNLAREIGDFVLKRADGLWAYQLAVVVDDAASQITHIVRGNDLLVSTARQIYLQQCLGYPEPVYAHLPILVNAAGQKLSKQTLAPAVNTQSIIAVLKQTLTHLSLCPPQEIDQISDLLQWAINNWQIDTIRHSDIVV